MNNKKFTYNDLIKKYTNLTPLEKFINFPFYTGVYSGKYNFKNTGSVILLNEDQKDLTFDDINNYLNIKYSNDQYRQYRDRNFEIVKEKFTNDISNSKLGEKYGICNGRVSEIIKKLHRIYIKNGKYTNIREIENIKEEQFTFYMNIYMEQRKVHEDDFLDACGFSVLLYNALGRAGIKYVKELKDLKVKDLHKIRNIGEKSIIELCNRCKELNIKLDESIISVYAPEDSSSLKIVDDDSIKKCGFSNGLCNALQNYGIITINDLKSIPLSKINNIKNLGRLRIKELINRCKELNIDLIEDVYLDNSQAKIDEELESEINNIKNKIYNLTAEKRALEIENKNLHQKISRIKREKRALEVNFRELRFICKRQYQIIHNQNK